MQITNNFNNINNVNFQGKKKKEKDPNNVGFKTMALAYMGGSMADFMVKAGYQATIGNSLLNGLSKKTGATENLGEVISNAIKYTRLDEKGLEFIDLAKFGTKEEAKSVVENIMRDEYNAGKFTKQLLKNPLTKAKHEKEILQTAQMFANGNNAGVFMKTNKLVLNSEKIGYSGFHEIGHALNRNFSKVGRALQKLRLPMQFAPAVLLTTALLTNKRTEDDKPQNFWQKTTSFVKNNVGKLTVLTCVPTIIEELMASHKGMKLAKGMLDKSQLKHVAKTNILGAASYIGAAVAIGFAAHFANQVRDNIVEKRQAAKAAKAQNA